MKQTFERIKDVVEKSEGNPEKLATAVAGDPTLEGEIKALVEKKTPDAWNYYWQGPKKPDDFLKMLVKKWFELNKMATSIQSKTLFDYPINLGTFLRPDYFLDAVREKTSGGPKYTGWFWFTNPEYREQKLVATMDRTKLSQERTVVAVTGAFVQKNPVVPEEGEEGEQVVEEHPVTKMSNFYFTWVPLDEEEPESKIIGWYSEEECVETPVYLGMDKTTEVCSMKIAAENSSVFLGCVYNSDELTAHQKKLLNVI